MNRQPFLAMLIIVLCLLTLLPVGNSSLSLVQPTARAAAWDETVKLGWFFARPDDGISLSTLGRTMDWVSLTRGHDHWLDDLSKAGYKDDVIQYFLGAEVQGPGPYKNSSSWCNDDFKPANNSVAYNVGDFCKYVHPNESWFLHNGDGERLVYKRRSGAYDYQMNPASGGWRSFFRDRVRRDLTGSGDLGFEGVYFDNIRMRLHNLKNQLHNSDGKVREYDDDDVYRREMVEYLAYLRSGLRDVGKLWANLTDFYDVSTEDYLKYTAQLDGYMNEAWGPGYVGRGRDVADEEQILRIAEITLGQGKELMALVQGQQGDYTRQRYGLAQYLLVSDGQQAYFRYAYNKKPYTDWWDYSNYDVKLGAPKGARYRSGNGWRRDFECGYVTVDIENQRGEIVQKSCSSGEQPTSAVKLPALIEAENYTSYYDRTDGNQGGEYRKDDVDIQQCRDGSDCYHVSHIIEREWLSYRIYAGWDDEYAIRLRVAVPESGQRVHIEVDGRDVTDSWTLPRTGDWDNWETVSKRMELSEGYHTIRVVAETGWFNFNYLVVEPAENN